MMWIDDDRKILFNERLIPLLLVFSLLIALFVPSDVNSGASHGRYFLCYPKMDFEEIYAILDNR